MSAYKPSFDPQKEASKIVGKTIRNINTSPKERRPEVFQLVLAQLRDEGSEQYPEQSPDNAKRPDRLILI